MSLEGGPTGLDESIRRRLGISLKDVNEWTISISQVVVGRYNPFLERIKNPNMIRILVVDGLNGEESSPISRTQFNLIRVENTWNVIDVSTNGTDLERGGKLSRLAARKMVELQNLDVLSFPSKEMTKNPLVVLEIKMAREFLNINLGSNTNEKMLLVTQRF